MGPIGSLLAIVGGGSRLGDDRLRLGQRGAFAGSFGDVVPLSSSKDCRLGLEAEDDSNASLMTL